MPLPRSTDATPSAGPAGLRRGSEVPHRRVLRQSARTRAAAVGVAAVLAVSGCGPIDAGSAAADRFEDWMSGVADVAEVDASGTNDLPFTGTASAVVTLDPDLTPEAVAAVVERAVTFDSNPSVSVSIDYPAGDFLASYAVSPTDRAANARLDELARALDAGTSATTVTIEVGPADTGIVAEGPGDFLTGFDQIRAVAAAHDPSMPLRAEFTSTDAAFSVIAGAGSDASDARRVYSTVAGVYPVIEAHLLDDAVELRVDVPRTPDVATLAGTVSRGLPVTVQFGDVTRLGEGDFTAAELVTSTAQAAAPVVSVDERPTWVRVVVPDLAAALSVDAAVTAIPNAGALLSLATVDQTFTLEPLPRGYAEYAGTLTELAAIGASVESVEVDSLRINLDLADGADIAAVGAALARAPRSCPLISLTVGGAYGLDIAPSTTLAASDVTVSWGASGPSDVTAALVAGWNSAH